ncbi:MAG: ABC transporter ATP-binding protein [Myxococcota bacterium]|nr:ABC transporter ATP-binding protein [Myxococcota bacterium]
MLELRSIGRTSDKQAVLTDVSLSVSPGELVSILGSTGSGKTSLLRLIMGLDLPNSGEVWFEDKVLARSGENLVPAEQRGFSLVFEKTVLMPFLNVADNILLGILKKDARAKQAFDEICVLLNLKHLLSRAAHSLSGGEQQRVALARSMLINPKLLLLDEPFRNIDKPWRDQLIPDLKHYLRQHGTAAVLVTHDREEAFSFSQRIFLLRQGRLVRGGDPKALYTRPAEEWDAQLLGECNIISLDTAAELWGIDPVQHGVKQVAVRPELIDVSSDHPLNATLVEKRYFGFYTTLVFQIEKESSVLVKVLAEEAFVIGERYRLGLKRKAQVHTMPLTPTRGESR